MNPSVGLSNILDGELVRRGPVKRSHREVVRAAVMDRELLGEVIEGVETVTGVKALLVLPVASLDLAVMTGCVRTNELMPDTQLGSSGFKQGGQITLAVGKTVSKFKAIIGLDTFHPDAPAGIPLDQSFEEVS